MGVILAVSRENEQKEQERVAKASGLEVEVATEYMPEVDKGSSI